MIDFVAQNTNANGNGPNQLQGIYVRINQITKKTNWRIDLKLKNTNNNCNE